MLNEFSVELVISDVFGFPVLLLTIVSYLPSGLFCMVCEDVNGEPGIGAVIATPLTQMDCILIQKSGKTPAGKNPAGEKSFIELPS